MQGEHRNQRQLRDRPASDHPSDAISSRHEHPTAIPGRATDDAGQHARPRNVGNLATTCAVSIRVADVGVAKGGCGENKPLAPQSSFDALSRSIGIEAGSTGEHIGAFALALPCVDTPQQSLGVALL